MCSVSCHPPGLLKVFGCCLTLTCEGGDAKNCYIVFAGPEAEDMSAEVHTIHVAPISAEGGVAMQGGMNIVLKTGASSLLMRDALRRPLAEIELGEVDASLRRVDSNVTRVTSSTGLDDTLYLHPLLQR